MLVDVNGSKMFTRYMSMAFTYEILGSDDRTPVLMVVIVSTVVIPENYKFIFYCLKPFFN